LPGAYKNIRRLRMELKQYDPFFKYPFKASLTDQVPRAW